MRYRAVKALSDTQSLCPLVQNREAHADKPNLPYALGYGTSFVLPGPSQKSGNEQPMQKWRLVSCESM